MKEAGPAAPESGEAKMLQAPTTSACPGSEGQEALRKWQEQGDREAFAMGLSGQVVAGHVPERKSDGQKVKRKGWGERQKEILRHVGQGIERGEIAEKVFSLERRYRGWDVDLVMGEQRRRRYERQYRQVQPLISQTLKALERRGLVRLIRRRQYVKRVELTDAGRLALAEMAETVLELQH